MRFQPSTQPTRNLAAESFGYPDGAWVGNKPQCPLPVACIRLTRPDKLTVPIITNAHRINQGQMPDLASAEGGDFYFVDAADPEEGVRKLLTIVHDRIPKRFGLDPVRDIQVLCPMNRGGLGARSLNIELQKMLNPPGEIRIERFGWTFCPGDKVMQIENDYDREVYNGDLGIVCHIDMEEGELVVAFDGREIVYGFG